MKYSELMKEGEQKVAKYNKKYNTLEYWQDNSSTTTVNCNDTDKAKAIIKKSKVPDQKLVIENINEALNNKLDISKLKDIDAENLIIDIGKHGKEGTDYKLVGVTLQYSDKIKKFVSKFVKENTNTTFSSFMNEAKKGMSVDEIKKAVDSGKKVYWSNKSYVVIKDKSGEYLIDYNNGKSYIGLTYKDGKTLNGEPEEFFMENAMNENTNTTFSSFMNEAVDMYEGMADAISRNTATNKQYVIKWLKKYYPKENDAMVMMSKYASSKRWKDIATAISGNKSVEYVDKKLKENMEGENNMKKTFSQFLNEQEEGKVDVSKIIKDLADINFKGSNSEQLKGLQLLKGLSTSDDELANKFMDRLSDAYTDIAKEIGVK